MSTEQPGRRPRQSSGGSPMGSTVAIVVTVVAVVLGFVILKQIRDDSGSSAQPASTTSTTIETVVVPLDTTPIVTVPAIVDVFTGTKVQVGNASTQNGAAGVLSTALLGKGFDMAAATDATIKLEVSKVLYSADVAGALDIANTVARTMGNIVVEVAPTPIPTIEAAFPEGTGVLVLLGNDRAGKTLAQMNGVVATTDSTTSTTTA